MAQIRDIILASASPQRRRLMKLLELPFKVHKSGAEELTELKRGVVHLVKHNASLKASDVAQHYTDAVVIGCDTVVYGDQTLIGKPKDLVEAKRRLKKMMRQPHWVYSGLTVIDTASQKTYQVYDKTKVFMNTLSNGEIDRYYQRMCPLDKAGGFDIEGLGSAFIHRIEGCYFNVVGLPLAKLTEILRECGVKVL